MPREQQEGYMQDQLNLNHLDRRELLVSVAGAIGTSIVPSMANR
jgi:hypothetical protein